MPDYTVSGTVTPDCTGDYTDAGEYNGQRYYTCTNEAGTWFLYSTDSPPFQLWRISAVLGATKGLCWTQSSLLGEYLPAGGAAGTATVAEYVEPPPTEAVLTARKYLIFQALQPIQAGQELRIPWSEIE